MTKLIAIFLTFFLFINFELLAKQSKSQKHVTVELELEEIPNIAQYEIQVKKIKLSSKEEVKNYQGKNPFFSLKLDVGNYLVRTRVISAAKEEGPWSDWSELLAPPAEVAPPEISKYNWSINKKDTHTVVPLSWKPATGASSYRLYIEDVKNHKVTEYTSKDTEHRAKLNAGEYKIAIQSVSKDGLKSKLSYFKDNFFVAKTQLPQIKPKIENLYTFSWKELPDTQVKIDIYRKAFFGDEYSRVDSLEISKAGFWKFSEKLKPGKYRLNFQYISDKLENGPLSTLEFIKKPIAKNFAN